MAVSKLKGLGVAMVTPFRNDKSIDFKALENLIKHLSNGADYLVVMGTTGENVTLSKDEKNAVLDFVIESNKAKLPIVYGIGGNNTAEVVNAIKERNFKGIDALLSVSPYFNKPAQAGIYEHFKEVASACPIPVMLYNVPGRTGSNMNADTTLKLAHDFKNIIAIKEASGNLEQISTILRDKPKNFQLISGDDSLILPIIALGGYGVISVSGNALPKQIGKLTHFALEGKIQEARQLHYKLIDFNSAMFAEGSPAGVKAALEALGVAPANLRLPLVPVSPALKQKIEKLVKELKDL
jgi:4-hydroxy-tetrahydrodipicolinate synthase